MRAQPEPATRWQHSPILPSLGPRAGLGAKVTSRADRVGLSLQKEEPHPSFSGLEVETGSGQAAPDLGRQANLELLVGRQGVGGQTLAAALSGVHARGPSSLLSPTKCSLTFRAHLRASPQPGVPQVRELMLSLYWASRCHLEYSATLPISICPLPQLSPRTVNVRDSFTSAPHIPSPSTQSIPCT